MRIARRITGKMQKRLEEVDYHRIRGSTARQIAAALELGINQVNYAIDMLKQSDKARIARFEENREELRAELERFHLSEINKYTRQAEEFLITDKEKGITADRSASVAFGRLARDHADSLAKIRGLHNHKLDVSGSLSLASLLGLADNFVSDDDRPPPIV